MHSKNKSISKEESKHLIDYFYSLDSGHKDFVRSMIHVSSPNVNTGVTNNLLITGSEDKSVKVFCISSGFSNKNNSNNSISI